MIINFNDIDNIAHQHQLKIKCLIILFVQFIKHDIIYTKDLEVEG